MEKKVFFYHFVAIFDVCWLENNIFYVYGGSRPSCEHPIPRYGSQQGGRRLLPWCMWGWLCCHPNSCLNKK